MLLAYIQKEGLATIHEIRDFYPEVRIIAMSGGMWAMDKSRTLQLAKGLDADLTIPKPIAKAELLVAVDHLLGLG
jgi:hypothetical protein